MEQFIFQIVAQMCYHTKTNLSSKHFKIALLVYAYIYLDRYLIDFLRASEAQRGSKYLYFFSWTLWVRENFYNSIFQIDFEFRDLKIRKHWKHMIMRDEDQQL